MLVLGISSSNVPVFRIAVCLRAVANMILRCNRHCYWLLQLSVLVLFACTATRSRWAVSATTFCQDVIQPFQHYDCSERTVPPSQLLERRCKASMCDMRNEEGCGDQTSLMTVVAVQVNTNDGFGLTLEHITPKNHYGAYAGHVLFFHTVFLGGEQWFLSNLPTPFALADGNYSVWVANMRTTPYGRGCSYYDVTQMVCMHGAHSFGRESERRGAQLSLLH